MEFSVPVLRSDRVNTLCLWPSRIWVEDPHFKSTIDFVCSRRLEIKFKACTKTLFPVFHERIDFLS